VVSLTRSRCTLILSLIALLLTAGCSSVFDEPGTEPTAPTATGTPSYVVTLHQPDAQSAYVQMDTDLYNIGEVVQFTVTNRGSGALACAGNPPAFSVKFQGINGEWVTRLGTEQPNETQHSYLEPGKSTQEYAFVTSGWDPGRYRIVHDCFVVREFILRPVPAIPAATAGPPAANKTTVTGNATVNAARASTNP
jgi:hypothetical protein